MESYKHYYGTVFWEERRNAYRVVTRNKKKGLKVEKSFKVFGNRTKEEALALAQQCKKEQSDLHGLTLTFQVYDNDVMSYIAGFVDGDGYIGIKERQIAVDIAQSEN